MAWTLETALKRTRRHEADRGSLDFIFGEIFYKINGETEQSYREEYRVKGIALFCFLKMGSIKACFSAVEHGLVVECHRGQLEQ